MEINIAKDFSEIPGGRLIIEGPFSGEEFREKFLKPKYLEARKTNQKLFIDFDGGYGYASCFLEEAFGGLKRELKDDNIFENLLIKSEEEPELIKQIESYMKES